MGCGSYGVTQVLVGLHRVGVVGLRKALLQAQDSGLADREAILDRLIETLTADNYFPKGQTAALRTALWREYLRYLGEDFREFFSEVRVTVRGEPGERRDQFVEMAESVFADFELKPIADFAEESKTGSDPELLIGDQRVVHGLLSRDKFKSAVRKNLSDW
jgi:hypothetical protein